MKRINRISRISLSPTGQSHSLLTGTACLKVVGYVRTYGLISYASPTQCPFACNYSGGQKTSQRVVGQECIAPTGHEGMLRLYADANSC
jgi:hypothetical protein